MLETDTFQIIGYEPSTLAHGGIGRLLMAREQSGALTYVGGVGTGLSEATARPLRRLMDAGRRDTPPIALKRKGAIWTKPIAAEIAFRGWTGDGKLRHASFKGVRDPADQ